MVSITEITGMEGEVISMQEIFRYQRVGLTPEGKIIGHFTATGVRSPSPTASGSGAMTCPPPSSNPSRRSKCHDQRRTDHLHPGLIFVAVIVLVEGVYLTVFGKSISLNSRVNRRLDMLEKGVGREQVLEQLRKEMGQHMRSQVDPALCDARREGAAREHRIQPVAVDHADGVLSVVAFVLLTIGTEATLPVRIGVSLGMGVGGIYFWVNGKAKKRIGMIEEQLPDACGTDGPVAARRPPVLLGAQHRGQGSARSLGHRNGHDRGRGRLWPRRGRRAQGHGRTARHAGPALPCRGRDDPADIGRQPGRDP
jgi:hypothetical protein